MRKILLFMPLALLLILTKVSIASNQLAIAEVKSSENKSTGILHLEVKITAIHDLVITGNPTINLPNGMMKLGCELLQNRHLKKDEILSFKTEVKYNKNNLPFFPQSFSISFPVLSKVDTSWSQNITAEGRIYFTPYETVEIFSKSDFGSANRVWLNEGSVINTVRQSFPKSQIPISNVDMAKDTIGGKDMDDQPHELIYVPGLAYLIPMKLTSDSMLIEDFDDGQDSIGVDELQYLDALTQMFINASNGDTTSLTKNILLPNQLTIPIAKSSSNQSAFKIRISLPKIHIHIHLPIPPIPVITRHFEGTVTGRITSTVINDYGKSIEIPLSGIFVSLKERDKVFDQILGQTRTDANGYYSIHYDTYQTLLEGKLIEPYILIKSKNEKYDIKAKKHEFLGGSYEEELYLGRSSGGDLTFNLNTSEDAFKAVSWATRCWEYNESHGIDLVNDLTILPGTKSTTDFIPDGLFNRSSNLFNPTIRIAGNQGGYESSVYHEFGHFVMWQVQKFNFIVVTGLQTGGGHDWQTENTSRMAWTEGWADAHQMIMDAAHYWVDLEYGADEVPKNEYEKRETKLKTNNGLNNEYYIACAIYDLWDGVGNAIPDSTPAIPPATKGTYVGYKDIGNWLTEDNIEFSYSEIVQPIADGGVGDKLHNIYEYFVRLVGKYNDCSTKSGISRAFQENRVVYDINKYGVDDLSINTIGYGVMTDGGIGQVVNAHFNGYIPSDLFKTPYDESYWLTYIQDGTPGTVDYRFFPGTSHSISDNIAFGHNPDMTTNLNLNTASGVFSSGIIQLPNEHQGTYSICGSGRIEMVRGTLTVGGTTGYHANLEVDNGGSVFIDLFGSLTVNAGSNIIVKSGGTLFIRSGSTVNVDGKIIVESGGYICIENGAILNFSQQSELHIDPNAIININPVLGSISHNCSNALNVCANLTGGNPNITVIPYLSITPVSPETNLPTGNSTVLRAGEAGLRFDGGYVISNSLGTFPNQGAIAFWMDPSVVESYRNPFSTNFQNENAGIRFEESTGGGFVTVIGYDDFHNQVHYYTSNDIKANTWYHVILTWSIPTGSTTGVVTGYLNGVKMFEESQDYWPANIPLVAIAGDGYNANRYYKGLMDDIGIYNKYLSSASDVFYAMQTPSPGDPNVIAFWDMHEGSGLTATDIINGNIATLEVGSTGTVPTWVTFTSPVTYTWSPPSGLNTTSGELVIANPASSITYTVTATATGYCSSSSTIQVNVGSFRLASQDQTQSSNVGNNVGSNISAYPNPASGNITIKVTGGTYEVEILDMQGSVLNKYNSVEEIININVSNLHTGLYLFQITQNGVKTRKKMEIVN